MAISRIINKIFTLLQDFQSRAYLNTSIKNGLKLGKEVIIRPGVAFGSEPFLVEIGNGTRVASGTTFVTHSGATANIRKIDGYGEVRNFGRIKVGQNCAIGSGCVILQNVEMGDNCVLGANSVLSDSMPSNTVFAGNPAKYVCEIEDYADVLKKTTVNYPIEIEQNRAELNEWLKKNLPHNYKAAKF